MNKLRKFLNENKINSKIKKSLQVMTVALTVAISANVAIAQNKNNVRIPQTHEQTQQLETQKHEFASKIAETETAIKEKIEYLKENLKTIKGSEFVKTLYYMEGKFTELEYYTRSIINGNFSPELKSAFSLNPLNKLKEELNKVISLILLRDDITQEEIKALTSLMK